MRDVVLCADAREALAGLADASVDAVVTDPPYALTQVSRGGSPRQNDATKPYGRHRLADKGFMGQQWDNGLVAHDPAFWAEALRVAKPGAFVVAFGGTRTYHRLVCAIEDAGWECRDMLNWLYGSGFPKSKSCLKPAHEPILLAKAPGPLQPLQIDASRVPTSDDQGRPRGTFPHSDDAWGNGHLAQTEGHSGGRWPPNTLFSHHPDCRPTGVRRVCGNGHYPAARGAGGLGTAGHSGQQDLAERHRDDEQVQSWQCVDGCPLKALDEQAGPRSSGAMKAGTRRTNTCGYRGAMPDLTLQDTYGDTGSASRFFPTFAGAPEPEDADGVPFRYCAKASRRERDAGLDDVDPARGVYRPNDPDENTIRTRLHGSRSARNSHPTVKPVGLMQWLCRLVCPADGVVLDPFAGSGSTGVACVREGLHYLLIEQDAAYVAIAQRRIAHEQERQTGPLFAGVAAAGLD